MKLDIVSSYFFTYYYSIAVWHVMLYKQSIDTHL